MGVPVHSGKKKIEKKFCNKPKSCWVAMAYLESLSLLLSAT
jgi:hypothetical protein